MIFGQAPDPFCPQCGGRFPGQSYCPDDGVPLTEPPPQQGLFPGMPRRDFGLGRGDVVNDRYEIDKMMGEGGMGAVYEVRDRHLGQKMALKVLHAALQTHDKAVRRFQREARAAATMNHPNICRVSDFGVTPEGIAYLVMEHLDGVDLFDMLVKERFMRPKRVIPIAAQIAGGLGHAHGHGIIHRDLKPENVFLVAGMPPPDYIKVLDFGIAKMAHGDEGPRLTATGEVVGTPEYLSPEQAGGRTVDHRCDLYSLGIILYRMLAGRLPFQDSNKLRLVRRQVSEAPQPFSTLVLPQQVPPQLEAVVMRLLEKEPDRRYQTSEEVQRALAEAKGISLT